MNRRERTPCERMRLPFREIATALQATSRNDIKCFARNGISDVTYATLSVIEQSNAATNPYFAISKAKPALEMVVLRILCHSAQRTLCHCEEQRDVAISRKGNIVNNMVVFIKLSKGHSCYHI